MVEPALGDGRAARLLDAFGGSVASMGEGSGEGESGRVSAREGAWLRK